MSELKSCPFCGTVPRTEMSIVSIGREDKVDFSVHCFNCGTIKTVRLKINGYATFFDVDKAEEQVVEAWNRRVTE